MPRSWRPRRTVEAEYLERELGAPFVAAASTIPPPMPETPRESQVRRAERELAAGCLRCGRPWKVHYRRGEFQDCGGVE